MDVKSAWVLTSLLLVMMIIYSANGARKQLCFKERIGGDKCTSPMNVTQLNVAHCCLFPGAKYYVNDVDAETRLLTQFGFPIGGCLPCNRSGSQPNGVSLLTHWPSNRNDSCLTVTCSKGKVCKVRRGNAKCVCPNCHTEREKEERFLCGTDGKTYKNECDFKKRTCRDGSADVVEIAYNGSCQSGCDNVVCRKSRTCVVDLYNLAKCVDCDFHCSIYSKREGPLCGADGKRYESTCTLRRESCRQGKTIGVAYKGECIANATCSDISCGNCELDKIESWRCVPKRCVMDSTGRPRCIPCSSCQESHPGSSKPTTLCGTDNKTYPDYCSLRMQMCEGDSFIDVKHSGPCKGCHPDSKVRIILNSTTSRNVQERTALNDRQSAPPRDEEIPPITASKPCKHKDLEMYYITLKHFVAILRKDFGLEVKKTNKKLNPRDKIILVRDVISSLQKKWKKIIVD